MKESEGMNRRQVLLLIRLRLLNCLGLNEVIHGKDGRKSVRLTGMLLVYLFVTGLMICYVAGAAVLLCMAGAGESVPAFAAVLSGLAVFVFSFLKAAPMLFDGADGRRLLVLPLAPSAVIFSRFFLLYLGELGISAAILLPASAVYLLLEKPGAGFFFLTLAALPFQALLPLTAAAVLGTVLLAAGAGMKHRRLVTLLLTMILSLLAAAASLAFAFGVGDGDAKDLGEMLASAVAAGSRFYPPAAWYSAAVAEGDAGAFGLLFLLSAGPFAVFLAVAGRYFLRITDALEQHGLHRHFQMRRQRRFPVLQAEYLRELRRYFASNIYVTNTLLLYLLMAASAAAAAVMGNARIAEALRLSEEETEKLLQTAFPFLMAFFSAMGTTTSVSLSIEGKQLWLLQSLPIRPQTVLLGKILVNLTVAVPAVLLSVLAAALGGWTDGLWTAACPLAFLWLFSVLGIWSNLKLPTFDWDSEAEAVKQSMSFLLSMLLCTLSILPAAAAVLILKYGMTAVPGETAQAAGIPEPVGKTALVLLILAGGTALYRHCGRIALRRNFC
ncbi:MAG TPA: hypothetical protein H9700_03275 [Candidatus Eisenbergiella intestinipullorum]|nr:hypothetical protein [Candidatus Eisenbergiella intestinipullorum]